jgi:hypothetical protein
MKTCTVYYDKAHGIRHTLVCEVDPVDGTHKVLLSTLTSNRPYETLEYCARSAVGYFGPSHVRVYEIAGYQHAFHYTPIPEWAEITAVYATPFDLVTPKVKIAVDRSIQIEGHRK